MFNNHMQSYVCLPIRVAFPSYSIVEGALERRELGTLPALHWRLCPSSGCATHRPLDSHPTPTDGMFSLENVALFTLSKPYLGVVQKRDSESCDDIRQSTTKPFAVQDISYLMERKDIEPFAESDIIFSAATGTKLISAKPTYPCPRPVLESLRRGHASGHRVPADQRADKTAKVPRPGKVWAEKES